MDEEMLSLEVAAERSGQSVMRLRLWCATGRLSCQQEADGWRIPASQLGSIAVVAQEHAAAVADNRVTALAVPGPVAPANLGDLVAQRLGLGTGKVVVTPLALDGIEYVVAVWVGEVTGDGGLPALTDLAVDLGAELLDGEVGRT